MQMNVQLRLATEGDIGNIQAWASAILAEQYMSRYLPEPTQVVAWHIIVVDGVDAGTVWLERRRAQRDAVFLGILIGLSGLFGKGVGELAIRAVIAEVRASHQKLAIRLNVRSNNARAIACYVKCGFVSISHSEKSGTNGEVIPMTTMQLSPR